VLSDDERRTLENWSRRRSTAQGAALRARIVLACAGGGSNTAVAARLGVSRGTVVMWRARFLARRLDGLGDEPRPGVPRTITDARVEEVIVRTLEEVPEGSAHWSKRELAPPGRDLADQRAPHLAGIRAAALADRGLQDLPGPAAHRQDPRRRRPLPCSAGQRRGLRSRRETADPGAAADRARAAHDPRGTRAAQLRLCPARHHRPVRRAEHRHRQGHRQAVRPAPGS
jgi:hypothetical protein